MKKIKILFIITKPIYGGATKMVLSIIERLDKDKFISSIIAGGKAISKDDLSYEIEKRGIDLILIPQLLRNIHPLKDFIAFIKLYYFIKRMGPDIVHTHTSKAGILGCLAAKLAGVLIIVHTPHGSIFEPLYFNRLTLFSFVLIKKLAARFTDKIITICKYEEDKYLFYKIANKDKFIIIYNGIDLNEFRNIKTRPQEIKKELGIPDSARVIGNVSRLIYEKGHLVLLKAFSELSSIFPDIYLLLVGEGNLRKKIEKEAMDLGIEKKIVLAGLRKDIPQIFSIIDIFVHPSLCDSFPLAIIEAMAAGKPIIATIVGGIPEMIDDKKNGLLVPTGDTKAFVEAIRNILKDEDLSHRLASQARLKSEMFNLDYTVKSIEKLYLDLFNREGLKLSYD